MHRHDGSAVVASHEGVLFPRAVAFLRRLRLPLLVTDVETDERGRSRRRLEDDCRRGSESQALLVVGVTVSTAAPGRLDHLLAFCCQFAQRDQLTMLRVRRA